MRTGRRRKNGFIASAMCGWTSSARRANTPSAVESSNVFAATADAPVRVEFFGDTIASIRRFAIETQRSDADLDVACIVPWAEIPRGERYRTRVLERYRGPAPVRAQLTEFLERGEDVPEAWLPLAFDERATIFDYLPAEAIVVLDEPAAIAEVAGALDRERTREQQLLMADAESGELPVDESFVGDALLAEVASPRPDLEEVGGAVARHATLTIPGAIENPAATRWAGSTIASFVLDCRPAEHFNRRIELFSRSVGEAVAAGETVFVVSSAVARTRDLLQAAGIAVGDALGRRRGGRRSWKHRRGLQRSPAYASGCLATARSSARRPSASSCARSRKACPSRWPILKVGDYVVHAVHGIGQYLGLARRDDPRRDARLSRPEVCRHRPHARAGHADASSHEVQRRRRRSRRASHAWAARTGRAPRRASAKSLAKIADGLVELYAERELARGHAFGADTPWQVEMEEAFPYEPTPDQQTAIDAAKARHGSAAADGPAGLRRRRLRQDRGRDARRLQSDRRQEASRGPRSDDAARRSALPHFGARFGGFPVRIEELSRFKSKSEQKEILRDLAEGKVDVVVGTHRLLQKDVVFRRPRVDRRRRRAALRRDAQGAAQSSTARVGRRAHALGHPDSAHAAHVAAGRARPVADPDAAEEPHVDQNVGRSGRRRDRPARDHGGARPRRPGLLSAQPRRVDLRRRKRAREARPAGAHRGRARADERSAARTGHAARFIDGEIDVLVATTIIENGIDIPNVNTIIVNDADKFGLAQLYQLRGRVGRSNHQAYCYLLYQAHKALTRRREGAARSDSRVHALGSGLADRDARPGDPRRRQPARRGAIGLHRVGRFRDVLRNAGRGDRASGEG